MGNCRFVTELNRLRKSSSDSIDNVEAFDAFKEYMHVLRPAESDLKDILRNVNASGKKTLVLLCGSAGDGKSHLLSYLKNIDSENLLEGYRVFNDATESSAPSMTAIETLNELLSPFKDENISAPGNNIILAINLGVLSNFIESPFGDAYSTLKEYVEKKQILTSQINDDKYAANSCFQHVSFSDYHMFSLTESGARGEYIGELMDRVFNKSSSNCFYASYEKHCSSCPLVQKCPVKMNFEYLMNKNRQCYIVEQLIRTIAQDKFVLTTREILNFIYDILVPQNFNATKYQKIVDDSEYLKLLLTHITPYLLFDSCDVTPLMNYVHNYDPLLIRSESSDELSISYYSSTNIKDEITSVFTGTSYAPVLCNHAYIDRLNLDRAVKAQLYSILVRVKNIECGHVGDDVYQKYLRDLFYFNSGNTKKLGSLYTMIQNSVVQWCGSDLDGNLCLDDRHPDFILYESISFVENIDHVPTPSDTDELQKFYPSIIVSYEDKADRIDLDVDYSLYNMVYRLNKGYIQTADDRNNHADFIGFVNRILQSGSLSDTMTITSSDGQRAVITKGKFGYRFKVVK